MSDEMAGLLKNLPDYLGGHLLLSLSALALGLAVSLPLGVAASRRPRLAEALLGAAGVLQTIPTLALLVLMVPLLGRIGFWPAFAALALYSVLPILSNTVAGIRGVDPALVEAGRGLGMSERQLLRGVQLPLAAPVIAAGVRTATVLVVGTATLATPVGGLSLGNYIFAGLEMQDTAATLFGCAAAALLALAMDQLVRLLEVAARRRSRRLAGLALGGLALALAGGLYGPAARLLHSKEAQPVVVASGPFTEQFILGEVLKAKLKAKGLPVDQRQGMGETIQFLALRHNQIDCCVNYTGNIWFMLMKEKGIPKDRADVLKKTTQFLREKYGVHCLGPLGFENAYTLVMRADEAEARNIKSIADLRKHAPRMAIGGDTQFFERPEWRRVGEYGLEFGRSRAMDPTLMYQAIDRGQVQVICAYSSDARINKSRLLRLEGQEAVFPPYDAVLLLSERAWDREGLVEALRPLVGAINDDAMREANRRVDLDHQRPAQAAAALLERIGQAP